MYKSEKEKEIASDVILLGHKYEGRSLGKVFSSGMINI